MTRPITLKPLDSESLNFDETEPAPSPGNRFFAGRELPLKATFHPLGFPLEVSSNSEQVIQAAWQSWHRFTPAYPGIPASLLLEVTDTDQVGAPVLPDFRTRGHLMSIT